ISGNGRYVAFHSMASNLVPGDTNETMDTFVHDRVTGGVDRVSVSESGEEGNHWSASGRPAFARGGREVIFATDAWNLLPETQEGDREVVARDRGPDLGVGAISLGSVDGQVRVGGWASFSGAVLASAADPADDGAGAAPRVGGEITAASAVLRPEAEDLLLRIDVSAIPGARPAAAPAAGGSATGWAGLPAVRYGFEIAAGPVRFEARVLRSTENDVPLGPTFHLYRCEPDCVRVGGLRGSYGNTGDSVRVALPLDRLGLEPGTPLSLRAHTALAESGGDPFLPLDEVTLPAATLAAPSVAVGTAPQGAPYEEVGFSPASLDSGRFTATLAEPEPNHDLWVRACLAETCSWTRREL
ncbi:MAG TPA: hypothetical protein VM638_06045, partial [Actinomycetota bacterium]|nr:hypothetical protein [Actinomycetota bacterium]